MNLLEYQLINYLIDLEHSKLMIDLVYNRVIVMVQSRMMMLVYNRVMMMLVISRLMIDLDNQHMIDLEDVIDLDQKKMEIHRNMMVGVDEINGGVKKNLHHLKQYLVQVVYRKKARILTKMMTADVRKVINYVDVLSMKSLNQRWTNCLTPLDRWLRKRSMTFII